MAREKDRVAPKVMAKQSIAIEELRAIVADISDQVAAQPDRGEVATYIPQLAKVDPIQFALTVVTAEGTVISAGDANIPFSIQSVSKVFTLALALGRVGEWLWARVGREPSGDPFNSIVQLEAEQGMPRNPFVNAGAIAVTDSILSHYAPKEALPEILQLIRFLCGDDGIIIDKDVARSEQLTGFRNVALANFMRGLGTITRPPEMTLGVYFHHCAIAMSTH